MAVIGARQGLTELILQKAITIDQIEQMRDRLEVGDEVTIEVWRVNPTGHEGRYEKVRARILRKYSHLALTDKGSASWSEIAILNRRLL